MRSGHSSGLRPINRLFILFHLTTSKKRVAMNCRAERKRLLLSLDTFTLRPRNGGMRPLRLWQNSWSHGMCRNPTDPQFFFEYEKVHSTKQSSPTCQQISSQKICAIKLSRSRFHYDDKPLSMIPLTWSVKDLKCWILWSSTPRHDDTWSFGLHRRKWNNCNGHGNIELPKSVKYLWILSNFIEVMSQQFDTLHFEACSLVIQAMEPLNIFANGHSFWKKEWFSIFSVQFLHTKHLVVDLPYLPLPHENHRKVV